MGTSGSFQNGHAPVCARAWVAALVAWAASAGCTVDSRQVGVGTIPGDSDFSPSGADAESGDEGDEGDDSDATGAGQPPSPAGEFVLTIAGSGGPFGSIVSSPAGIDCSAPPCSARFAAGSAVRVTAFTTHAGGFGFAGWNGPCAGVDDCEVVLDRDLELGARFGAANVAFVTSGAILGAFGPTSAADQFCGDAARRAALPGSYQAWISTSGVGAIDRIRSSDARGWMRPDGKPLVDDPDGILRGATYYPMALDEQGADVADNATAWTGTWIYGQTTEQLGACGDWSDPDALGAIGNPWMLGISFSVWGSSSCGAALPLLCFGVNEKVAIAPRPVAGRIGFVTSTTYAPGGGLGAADALCQSDAINADLPGTYRAVLGTTTASAASRFDLTGPAWVRPDGTPIAGTATAFFQGSRWLSAPNLTTTGEYTSNEGVWSGGTSLLAPGSPGDTCNDWTSATGTAPSGRSGMNNPTDFYHFAADRETSCAATYIRLSCLQE